LRFLFKWHYNVSIHEEVRIWLMKRS